MVGPVDDFLDDFGRRLAAAAGHRGAEMEAPHLDQALVREVLDLARLTAHTQERRFAPLASFLAGVAVARFEAAGGQAPADLIREVREQLEAHASEQPPA